MMNEIKFAAKGVSNRSETEDDSDGSVLSMKKSFEGRRKRQNREKVRLESFA